MIELGALCGVHVLSYPVAIAQMATRGTFFAFMAGSECGVGWYLIETDSDRRTSSGSPNRWGAGPGQLPRGPSLSAAVGWTRRRSARRRR
jgi:hypothetical protein